MDQGQPKVPRQSFTRQVFFKILKSGCQVEKLQLNCAKRYSPCLALYLIIAWRIFYLTWLSRLQPDSSCEPFFENIEWKTAYLMVHKKPPDKPPTLSFMILTLATLGGFLKRKSDKHPGSTTIWIGLQRLTDMVLAAQVFYGTYG